MAQEGNRRQTWFDIHAGAIMPYLSLGVILVSIVGQAVAGRADMPSEYWGLAVLGTAAMALWILYHFTNKAAQRQGKRYRLQTTPPGFIR